MTLIPYFKHSIPLLRFPFYRTAKIQNFLNLATFIFKKFQLFFFVSLKWFFNLYTYLKALLRLLILSRFQWGKDRNFTIILPK